MSNENSVNRRDFLKTASVTGALTGLAGSALRARRPSGRPRDRRK